MRNAQEVINYFENNGAKTIKCLKNGTIHKFKDVCNFSSSIKDHIYGEVDFYMCHGLKVFLYNGIDDEFAEIVSYNKAGDDMKKEEVIEYFKSRNAKLIRSALTETSYCNFDDLVSFYISGSGSGNILGKFIKNGSYCFITLYVKEEGRFADIISYKEEAHDSAIDRIVKNVNDICDNDDKPAIGVSNGWTPDWNTRVDIEPIPTEDRVREIVKDELLKLNVPSVVEGLKSLGDGEFVRTDSSRRINDLESENKMLRELDVNNKKQLETNKKQLDFLSDEIINLESEKEALSKSIYDLNKELTNNEEQMATFRKQIVLLSTENVKLEIEKRVSEDLNKEIIINK